MMECADMPGCVFAFDTNRVLQGVSAAMKKELGRTGEELAGQLLDAIFPVATRIFWQTHVMPLLNLQGFAREMFVSLKDANDQEVPVILDVERRQEVTVVYWVTVIVVRQRQQWEADLLLANKNLERAIKENAELLRLSQQLKERSGALENSLERLHQQHQELAQFGKIVTHDMQEPLRKLILFSEAIEVSLSQIPEETHLLLSRLRAAATRMRAVITGLQQYLWLTGEPGQITAVDLGEAAREAMNTIRLSFPDRDIRLETQGLPTINGNREQLVRLLMHVFDNAVRYRSGKTTASLVTVTGGQQQYNAFRHVQDAYAYQDYLRIQIIDNGEGFDPALAEKIFELFYTHHPADTLGLGLALSRKIVENHHGTIRAHSIPGQGSTITILLPLGPLPAL